MFEVQTKQNCKWSKRRFWLYSSIWNRSESWFN